MKHSFLIVLTIFFANYTFSQGITKHGKETTTGTEFVSKNGAIGSANGVDKNGKIVLAVDPIPTVTSSTGRVWMDRNLGATRIAQSSTDFNAYGDLYQWGRGTDGHQTIVWTSSTASDGAEQSNTTTVRSSSPNPGAAFIIVSFSNWYSGSNPDNLWKQDGTGVNNPCPSGYRLPTVAEWEAEVASWGSGNSNAAGAFASPLKLPMPGRRIDSDGLLSDVSTRGYYWSSEVSSTMSRRLIFDSSRFTYNVSSSYRANGFSVRCIKH